VFEFPQFLRSIGEIDMGHHAWMEYDPLRISGRWDERFGYFRGKTKGPVGFETVGMCLRLTAK